MIQDNHLDITWILIWKLNGNNLLFPHHYLLVSTVLSHYYHIITEL